MRGASSGRAPEPEGGRGAQEGTRGVPGGTGQLCTLLEVWRTENETQAQWEAVCEVLIRGVQKVHHARVSYGELKFWIAIDLQILIFGHIWPTLLFLLSVHCLNPSLLCTKRTIHLLCPYSSESYRSGMNSVSKRYLYSVEKQRQAVDGHLREQGLTWGWWIIFLGCPVCVTNPVMTPNLQAVKISWKESCARSPLWLNPLLNTYMFLKR